jgi:cholesterol transport system auxiliary component
VEIAMPRCKNTFIPLLLLIIFLTLGPAACLDLKQPRTKIEYYTLEYDPPVPDHHPPLSEPIRVNQFAVSPIYNTNRIIYREGLFKREAYVYHKWRANPAEVVTYLLRRDLQQSGLFKAVVSRESRLPSVYVLEGSVDEFLEWNKEMGWEAFLSLSVILMQENEPDISKKILFQKTYFSNKPCRQKNPGALAEAMSSAMSEISKQIIIDIYQAILSTGTQ